MEAKFNWFPGHMAKQLRKLKEVQIKKSNLILHLRDSRLPITSQNEHLSEILRNKTVINVFTKSDLIRPNFYDSELSAIWSKKSINPYSYCLHSNLRKSSGLINIIKKSISREFKTTFSLLTVIGIPNVGKSSLINSLRSSGASSSKAKVASYPGFTRGIDSFIVSTDPNIALYDSPGILPPRINGELSALKLSLVNTINEKNHFFEEEFLVKFLLVVLNGLNQLSYLKVYGIKQKTSDFKKLLQGIRKKHGCNDAKAMSLFIRNYRLGDLGKFVLDDQRVEGIFKDNRDYIFE